MADTAMPEPPKKPSKQIFKSDIKAEWTTGNDSGIPGYDFSYFEVRWYYRRPEEEEP